MRRRRQKVTAFVAAVLTAAFLSPSANAAEPQVVSASSCGIAASGDVRNNTLNCNFGLTPEQLRQTTKAAVAGATEPLMDRIEGISKRLGVTTEAAKSLLRIVGEQPDTPDEKLPELLAKVATDYKRLQTQVSALNPDNPTAHNLVEHARQEIAAGHFDAAHGLLTQARQAQIAAAEEAVKLAREAEAARDAQLLGAAASAAAEGDLAMTELNYLQAAGLFEQAEDLVPAGHPSETADYLIHRADALYRQGKERGDNVALLGAIAASRLALEQQPRERMPLAWASTENRIGAELATLGEREAGTARLNACPTRTSFPMALYGYARVSDQRVRPLSTLPGRA
jgi:hypothetical protein